MGTEAHCTGRRYPMQSRLDNRILLRMDSPLAVAALHVATYFGTVGQPGRCAVVASGDNVFIPHQHHPYIGAGASASQRDVWAIAKKYSSHVGLILPLPCPPHGRGFFGKVQSKPFGQRVHQKRPLGFQRLVVHCYNNRLWG